MHIVRQTEIAEFLDSARLRSARLIVAYCLHQNRNEWVNWGGETNTVTRWIGHAYPSSDSANAAAETHRSPGTVLAIQDSVGIELACDKGFVIVVERFSNAPFGDVSRFLRDVKTLDRPKAYLNALQRGYVTYDVYSGNDSSFVGYSAETQLYRRSAQAGGKKNGLAWSMTPYTPIVEKAKDVVERINVLIKVAHPTSNGPTASAESTINVPTNTPQTSQLAHETSPIKTGNLGAEDVTPSVKEVASQELENSVPVTEEPFIPPPPPSPLNDTEKEQLTKARVGQGLYRKRLEEIECRCRLTGVSDMAHLRASHIKPWRDCADAEKLDGNNGLLLSPHIDHLFDKGYISFSDSGDLLLSSTLEPSVLTAWHLNNRINVGSFNPRQRLYLAYHRANIFKD